jgi:hypothetical protein
MTYRSYEVRVTGPVPSALVESVGAAAVSEEPAQTVILTGPADQAALLGFLARLRALGIELVEVRELTDVGEPPAAGSVD